MIFGAYCEKVQDSVDDDSRTLGNFLSASFVLAFKASVITIYVGISPMESKDEESKLDISDAKAGPDDFDGIDPIVGSFLEFSYGQDLSDVAEDWITEHASAGGFDKKSQYEEDGSGHPISWSNLHREYCEAIDGKLEAFCEENGTTAAKLFEALEEAMENEEVADALPGFVKLTSYEHFCSQMESHATAEDKLEEAQEMARAGTDPWSGEWRGLYDFETRKRDKHLSEHDVPWSGERGEGGEGREGRESREGGRERETQMPQLNPYKY
jgi:hypothetical protein